MRVKIFYVDRPQNTIYTALSGCGLTLVSGARHMRQATPRKFAAIAK